MPISLFLPSSNKIIRSLQKTYFEDVRLEIFRQVFYQWYYQGLKGTCQVPPTGQYFSKLRFAYAYLMSSGLCI